MSVTSSAPIEAGDVKRSRLFFVCIPRSGSTALLKCLSFIDGVEAWFEPYVTAHHTLDGYRSKTGKDLPTEWSEEKSSEFNEAAQYITKKYSLPFDFDGKKLAFSDVKHSMDNLKSDKVIVKDIGNSFINDHLKYLPSPGSGFKYIFLIRDPQLAITSYRKAYHGHYTSLGLNEKTIESFDLDIDVPSYASNGRMFKNEYDTWRHVEQNLDPDPLIIDFEDLMANPKPCLQKICEVGGLQFHDGMLEWDASPDIVQTWKNPGGVAKILIKGLGPWHQTAINTSCFQSGEKEKPPLSSVSKDVQRAVANATEYYNEMYERRFMP